MKAVFGYREAPTNLEALAYFAYVVGMVAWYLRGILRSIKPDVPVAVPSPGPQ